MITYFPRRHKTLAVFGCIFIGLLVVVFDQATKFWVLNSFGQGEIFHITDFLNISLVYNHGVTFGWLKAYSDEQFYLLTAAIVVVMGIVCWWWIYAKNLWQRYASTFIIAGALGNLIDRIRYRAVVDFLDFHFSGWHWYTFNVADSAIVCGVGLLLLENYFVSKGRVY